MTYGAVARTWDAFFLLAGTTAATLLGLLFVGLALHLRVVIHRQDVRGLARTTLTNFSLVLLLALYIDIPQDASAAATELIVSGAVNFVIVMRTVVSTLGSDDHTLSARILVLRFGVSVAASLAVVAAGALLNAGLYTAAFSTAVALSITLLIVSLRNTWDLLITVGEAVG